MHVFWTISTVETFFEITVRIGLNRKLTNVRSPVRMYVHTIRSIALRVVPGPQTRIAVEPLDDAMRDCCAFLGHPVVSSVLMHAHGAVQGLPADSVL